MNVLDKMMSCVEVGNRLEGVNSFIEWNKHEYGDVLNLNMLEQFCERLGDDWKDEHLSLAQIFVAVKIVEDIIDSDLMFPTNSKSEPNIQKGPLIIGNIEDDFHGLGRKIVVAFLRSNNWEVIDLGNDISPEEFIDTAVIYNSRLIVVSAMMYTTACNIKKVRELLDQRGLSKNIKLAVGGAVFKLRPELVKDVGADGSSITAMDAPSYFLKLWNSLDEKDVT